MLFVDTKFAVRSNGQELVTIIEQSTWCMPPFWILSLRHFRCQKFVILWQLHIPIILCWELLRKDSNSLKIKITEAQFVFNLKFEFLFQCYQLNCIFCTAILTFTDCLLSDAVMLSCFKPAQNRSNLKWDTKFDVFGPETSWTCI